MDQLVDRQRGGSVKTILTPLFIFSPSFFRLALRYQSDTQPNNSLTFRPGVHTQMHDRRETERIVGYTVRLVKEFFGL